MSLKITTIIGARPQFIKASAVSRAIRNHQQPIEEIILHTGQHYDENMSTIFFDELGLKAPDIHLGIHGGSHAAMTSEMLAKIGETLAQDKPDFVLVYGDTNSTLAGALAASKLHIPIAHVEAGLRSGNMKMPEEVNRILTDRISTLLFCPTETAMTNLESEGIKNWVPQPQYSQIGDVMYDNALYFSAYSKAPTGLTTKSDFILATIHRAENTDDRQRLVTIIESLKSQCQTHQVVLPLHPRTAKLAQEFDIDFGDIHLIEPQGYLHMIWLLQQCRFVVTDSGGVQKEAYFFKKPCITVRDETEWVELVEAGWNYLAPPHSQDIINQACDNALRHTAQSTSLYGAGDASEKIIAQILASK